MGNLFSKKKKNYGIKCGNERLEMHMIKGEMNADLLQFFQELPFFNYLESELESNGFEKCVDYPELSESHTYYEGYFHTFPPSGLMSSSSIHPRNGRMFDKPAAPIELRSFYSVLRSKNHAFFDHLVVNLSGSKNETSRCLVNWITHGKVFSDIAVQIHFGQDITNGIQNEGYHNDSVNSILHLALSVRGTRSLNSKRWHRNRNLKKSPQVFIDKQTAGCFYLSSPTFFPHTVEYFDAPNYGSRIVAVQSRFLLLSDDLVQMRLLRSESDANWIEMAAIIAQTLREAPFLFPTLEEVRNCIAKMTSTEDPLT